MGMVYDCDRCGTTFNITYQARVIPDRAGHPYQADLCAVCMGLYDEIKRKVDDYGKKLMKEYKDGYFKTEAKTKEEIAEMLTEARGDIETEGEGTADVVGQSRTDDTDTQKAENKKSKKEVSKV